MKIAHKLYLLVAGSALAFLALQLLLLNLNQAVLHLPQTMQALQNNLLALTQRDHLFEQDESRSELREGELGELRDKLRLAKSEISSTYHPLIDTVEADLKSKEQMREQYFHYRNDFHEANKKLNEAGKGLYEQAQVCQGDNAFKLLALSTRLNQAVAQDLLVDEDFSKFDARASLITNQIEHWIADKTRSCSRDRRQAIHAEFAQLQGALASLLDAGAKMAAYRLSTDVLEARMAHDLGELRDGLHEYADHWHERLRVFSLVLPLLIMSIMMLAAVLLVRSILRPLNQLVEYTQSLKRDEYSASVPSGGKDELGILAATLGDMSTHLLNANRLLKEQIQSNQTVLLSSPLPIGVYEASGQCILANEAYATLVGAAREELLAQNFNTIAAWQKTGLINDCRTALEHQIPKYREIKATTSFGKELCLACRLLPIQLNGHAHLLTQFVDLTEHKHLEDEMRHTIKQQHAREEELRVAHQVAEEATRVKSRFLAAAGHDLRQPLAAANLFIGTLKFTKPSSNQSEIIESLEGAMSNFNGLLNALLDISKLESGAIEPEYGPVAMADIAQWLKQSFAPMAQECGLDLRLRFPTENLVVLSDFNLIKQVLGNLVSNAIKYTPQGAILVSARRRETDVLFQVWDTGIGIEADQFEHIFEGFYQINNPQGDSENGLGLGLAIVKRALELLDVEITCRSQFGHGSVFGFSLPLDDSGQAPRPVSTPAHEGMEIASFAQGKRFVVLENDRLVGQGISSLLAAMGAEVKLFKSAEDALRCADTEKADYYICDYMLDGALNGLQFLNQLRQKLGTPINGLLMSGDTSPAFIRETKDCGWPVLSKPVNTSRLISSLRATGRSR